MCGIAGFVAPGQPDVARRATRAMVSALRLRGLDGEGLDVWPDAALGHRRLAILDLSEAGRQPMSSPDGEIGLVFNGCIYNFLELRKELEARGCVFRSRCDTEVLLEGYREWGIDRLVQRIRGMFAFAIWDQPRRILFLVRDRLGVKPLVYSRRGQQIAFASTIDALSAAGMTGGMKAEAVLEFLEYGFVTDERAIFDGVRKLAPATILEWRDGEFRERRYWDLPRHFDTAITFDEAVEETERLVIEAVRLRLRADVPVGVLLSGGIDSALICWAMAKANANIGAYTVAAPGDSEDESAAARETARILGVPHHIVPLPERAPTLIDEMIESYSEPFAAHSAQGILLVSKAVKASATVLLTGDGGDDIFLGYPFMRHAWIARRVARHLPCFAPALWKAIRPAIPASGIMRRFRSLMDYSTMGLSGHARAHDGLPWYEARSFFGDRLKGVGLRQREMEPSFESARSLLSDVLEYHRRTHFTGEFMPKVDGGTMHHAVEARSPLLDQVIWEFGATLPYELRYHGGQSKAVLREIVRRRVSPRVAARGKQGFTVPVERWLAKRWRSSLDLLARPTLLERDGWIQAGRMKPAVEQAEREGLVPVQLWYLLILERWLERRGSGVSLDPA